MSSQSGIISQTTTTPDGTVSEHRALGTLIMEPESGNPGQIRLGAADNSGFGVEIVGPATMAAAYRVVYPAAAPGAGEVMEVQSVIDGVVTMGWAAIEAAMPIGEVVQAADGTLGAPGFTFAADTNTGIYRPASDTLAFSAGGVLAASFFTFGGNVFATITAASFTCTATIAMQVTAPAGVAIIADASNGGKVSLREATGNGTSSYSLVAPAAMGGDKTITLSDAALADGAGMVLTGTAGGLTGTMKPSIWANAIPITVAENGLLSTSTASGYQFSTGDTGTGYQGIVLPFAGLVVGMSMGVAATTVVATVELAVNGASVGSGHQLAMAGGSRRYHTTFTTPYVVAAGDAVTGRTTSVTTAGQQNTLTIWVVPTE